MPRTPNQPDPKMPAPLAGRVLLKHNLQIVRQRLEQSADKKQVRPAHIHQLRVSTRRSIAVLDLYREFLPAKPRRRTARTLKKIRNSAGKARDLDVLIERYESGSKRDRALAKKLRGERAKAQRRVVSSYQRINRDDQFDRDRRKLLAGLRNAARQNQPGFRQWARRRLRECVSKFFRHRPADTTSLSQLHRFRIAAKQFRYSLELLEPAFPRRSFRAVKPEIRRLQDLLGQINDHAVAVARIHRMQGKGQRISEKFQQREVEALITSRQDFANWWSPKRVRQLRREFKKIVDASTGS